MTWQFMSRIIIIQFNGLIGLFCVSFSLKKKLKNRDCIWLLKGDEIENKF